MTRGVDDEPTEPCRTTSHGNVAAPPDLLHPAILLLLTEEARLGCRLLEALPSLGRGPLDRASAYRALSEMEADQLLRSSRDPVTGATGHVYEVTEAGMIALRGWMAILAEERDALDSVLKRFDALLGEER
jgi:DNA-binding PadR family transcriptional regulator